MASNRHLGRIIALQTLYEQDFRRDSGDQAFDLDQVLQRNIARYESMVDDKAFIERLVHGVTEHESDLDDTLRPVAPEWPIDNIAKIDLAILRLAVFELTTDKKEPPKVVIDEAIELAKEFGNEHSSKFVNGVLGTILKSV